MLPHSLGRLLHYFSQTVYKRLTDVFPLINDRLTQGAAKGRSLETSLSRTETRYAVEKRRKISLIFQ